MPQAAPSVALRRIGAIVFLALALPTGSAAGTDLAWKDAPALGVARSDVAVMTFPSGPSIYAAGGMDASDANTRVTERLDPSGSAWERLPDLNEARTGASAAAVAVWLGGNDFRPFPFVFGGCCAFIGALTSVEAFTTAWYPQDDMSSGHSWGGAASSNVGGFDPAVYLIGGGLFSSVTGAVDQLRLRYTSEWRPMSPMPTPRSHLGTATLGDTIYAVGGQDAAGNPLATVEIYDPAADRWSAGPSLPLPRTGLGLAALDGKLYAVGGRGVGGVFHSAEMLDPATGSWTHVSGPATPRYDLGVTAAAGKLYAIGGRDAAGHVLASVEAAVPIVDTTPPVIEPKISGVLGDAGWYRSDVELAWQISDPESPESVQFVQCVPLVTIVVDTAGRLSDCTASSSGGIGSTSVTIKRDATAPSLTASAMTPDGTTYVAGTHTAAPSVKVTFSCTDALSGVATVTPPVKLGPADGDQQAAGTCVDGAGNTTQLAFAPVLVDTIPALGAVDPSFVRAGGDAFTLVAKGEHLTKETTLSWNGVPLATVLAGPNELHATVPAAQLAITGDLAVVRIAATKPSGLVSNVVPLTVARDKVAAAQSAIVAKGETATVSTAPSVAGAAGMTAALTAGGGEATVTAARYDANPTGAATLDAGGGFVDLRVGGAAGATVAASVYYPSTVTGAAETALDLLWFDGSAWRPVRSAGGAAPVKNTTDDLDGTVSGGRFTVTFDATSTPAVTGLTGTVLAVAHRDRTKPTIVASATADGQPYTPGAWSSTSVQVSFECTDPGGSGVASVTGPQTVDTEGRRKAVRGVCVDNVGNRAHAALRVSIDRTPPTCTATATPAVLALTHRFITVRTRVDVDDDLSGPAGFTLVDATTSEGSAAAEIRGFAIGSRDTAGSLLADRDAKGPGRVYSLVYEAADRAGNRSRCTARVTVPH